MSSAVETEQDVIIGLVLPFLRSLGFGPHEIKAERSFSLRLGHYVYRIDTEEQVLRAAPRLDILVTRNNKNLFVVEAKRDGLPLTEQDRDQAISYARLTNPITPFVLVTNGNAVKLYETLTRSEINSADFVIKSNYDLSISLEMEHEFLQNFISYSALNLQIFSHAQVTTRTQPLVGSITDRSAKYIPEIYEPRLHLEAILKNFVNSPAVGLAILGDSGTGKTSALCHLALSTIDRDQPLFFYRGFELSGGLLSTIAQDFNWHFSQHFSDIELARRLSGLRTDNPIIFVLDAIDEWTFDGKAQSLLGLLSRLSGDRIKFIFSCKTAAWSQFVIHRGSSTGLNRFLYPNGESPFFSLSPMEDKEFYRAYEKHQKAYHFDGFFEDNLLRAMQRNPFLMRIAFEVATKRGIERLTLSDRELFTSYYDACLDKLGTKNSERWSAQDLLDGVAGCLFANNQPSVSKASLKDFMGGNLEHSALAELVDFNILEIEAEDEAERLGFYFSKLRDYIVAFRLRRWNQLSIDEFSEEIAQLSSQGVHQDVLIFFYPLAGERKRELIDGALRRRAEEYLDLYTHILGEHFIAIRRRFPPYTSGSIGFIGQIIIPEKRLGFFGFRERKDRDEKILLLPISRFEHNSNLPDLYGGKAMHAFGSHFLELDWKRTVAQREIGEQLISITDRGLLDESRNIDLLSEIIPALVLDKRGMFKVYGSPSFSDLFPLDLNKSREGLRMSELEEYYQNEIVDEKIARGELSSDEGYGFPSDFSDEDLVSLQARVATAMRAGKVATFRWGRSPTDQITSRFLDAAANLQALGVDVIGAPTVSPDFSSAAFGPPHRPIGLIRQQFLLFYEQFLRNYKILIEANFLSLSRFFGLYSQFPAKIFINLEKPPYYKDDYELTIFTCKGVSSENEIAYFSREDVPFEEIWRRSSKFSFRGTLFEVISASRGGLSHFCSSGRYVDFPMSSGRLLLRGAVYRQIRKELPKVIDALSRILLERDGEIGTSGE